MCRLVNEEWPDKQTHMRSRTQLTRQSEEAYVLKLIQNSREFSSSNDFELDHFLRYLRETKLRH